MTRQRSLNRILGAAVLFIAVLTILIAFPAPAQQAGTGQPSAESSAAFTQQARPPLRLWENLASGPLSPQVSSPPQSQRMAATAPDGASSLFLPAVLYESAGKYSGSVAIGDLNRDGTPDIVVSNLCPRNTIACREGQYPSEDGVVSVLLANGDGTFKPAAVYDSGGGAPSAVAITDLNGDGNPDLVVANECGAAGDCSHSAVSVLLGNGDGTFQPAVTYAAGGYQESQADAALASVVIGDINGDGKPDLVVTNQCSFTGATCGDGVVGVLLGNGDGTFEPSVTYDPGGAWTSSVALGDVNNDGKLDIVVTNCGPVGGTGCGTGAVGVLLGNGNGTFQPVVLYDSAGSAAISASVADLNGDGKLDLLVANYCGLGTVYDCHVGSISLLLGKGNGTFQTAVPYPSGGDYAGTVISADINGDEKRDVVLANPGSADVSVFLGNGDGTLQAAVTYSSGGALPQSVEAADLNGDNSPDLVLANWCEPGDCDAGTVGVLLNNTPFCTTPPVITVSTTPTALWPPKGNMIPVTVSGTITDTGCTVASAAYAVTDEYGQVQPSGTVTLGAGGAYSFTVLLQASRLRTDLDGRLYTITVSASNNAGKTGSQAGPVIVPHDQGH